MGGIRGEAGGGQALLTCVKTAKQCSGHAVCDSWAMAQMEPAIVVLEHLRVAKDVHAVSSP